MLQVRIVPRDVRKKSRPRRRIRRILDALKIALAGCQSTVAPPQRRLYFLLEPHGTGSLRRTLGAVRRASNVRVFMPTAVHPDVAILPQKPCRHMQDEQQPSRRRKEWREQRTTVWRK